MNVMSMKQYQKLKLIIYADVLDVVIFLKPINKKNKGGVNAPPTTITTNIFIIFI